MKKIFSFLGLITVVALLLLTAGIAPKPAYAAALTSLSDTLSTAKVSTASNNDISFVTPTGIPASGTITITFPATWVASTTISYTDIDLLDNGVNVTLAASPTGTTWGAARASSTAIVFTNGSAAVTAGHTIRIKIGTNATNQTTGVNQVTNGSSTGSTANGLAISTSAGDTGTISVALVSDDTVAISATVSQSLTFSLSANTIAFGTLDSAAARYANTTTGSGSDVVAHTLAVSTNGASGYTITVQGGTLTSQQNSANTITAIGASPATSSTGSEQFGIYATKSGGVNGTIAAPYATASSFGYNGSTSTAATFASGTTATATETYSLHYLANISATTEAGTYSTSLNYVATANF